MNRRIVTTRRLSEFDFLAPLTLKEAVALLAKYRDKAKILSGGTDLLSMMKRRLINPEVILSLKNIPHLNYIRYANNQLVIGAMTDISTILSSELVEEIFPSLHAATKVFGTPQIRNMATIGGNICRSSPCADTVPPLISFGAALRLIGAKREREILLEDFFCGAGENVLEGEILYEIVVPIPDKEYVTSFLKLTRNTSDLAKVNCAVMAELGDSGFEDIKVALGAISDRPIRLRSVEQALLGKETSHDIIDDATSSLIQDISPISDGRSTAEYRENVSQTIVRRALYQALEQYR